MSTGRSPAEGPTHTRLSGVVVEHLDPWLVDDLPSTHPHPCTPVEVFLIEEEALIHPPDFLHGLCANEHGRAYHPVDCRWLGAVGADQMMVQGPSSPLRLSPNGSPSKDR